MINNKPLKIPILFIGKTPITDTLLKRFETEIEPLLLPFHLENLLEPVSPLPQIIFCYPSTTELSVLEAAQSLKMQYPNQAVYFVGLASDGYEKKDLIKNGFNDAFLLPLDDNHFQQAIFDQITASKRNNQLFRSVELVDIQPNAVLDFDIYLFMPFNQKYVIFYRAGEILTEELVNKLKRNKINSMHIELKDTQKFYEHTADKLKSLPSDSDASMSETERREKLQYSVRRVFSSMLSNANSSIQTGKQVIEDFKEIINRFILKSNTAGEWQEKIKKIATQANSPYDHASATASYAAFFSMGTGIGDPEEMALAALLHDIGLVLVPISILEKNPQDRTLEEKKEYEKHPEHSVNLIQNKKLTLSALAYKVILQHHEHYNGTGYPKGASGNRLCPEAQILGIADRFDEIVHSLPHEKILSPLESIKILEKENQTGNYDTEILNKIVQLFQKE